MGGKRGGSWGRQEVNLVKINVLSELFVCFGKAFNLWNNSTLTSERLE